MIENKEELGKKEEKIFNQVNGECKVYKYILKF